MSLTPNELGDIWSALGLGASSLLHRAKTEQKRGKALVELNDTQVGVCRGLVIFKLLCEAKSLDKGNGKSAPGFRLTSMGEDVVREWERRHEAARRKSTTA